MLPLLALLTALPAFVAAKEEEPCVYERDHEGNLTSSCINTRASVSADFTFPLFPDGAKFVYAVDGISPEELVVLEKLNATTEWKYFRKPRSTMMAYWLEYDTAWLEIPELLMVTEMNLLLTNQSTGGVGGGSNGCERLLGAACIDDVKSRFREKWTNNEVPYPLAEGVFGFIFDETPPESCPKDLFQSRELYSKLVAVETPPNVDTSDIFNATFIRASTNASDPIARQLYRGRDLKTHISNAAVAVINRYPLRDSPTNEGRAMAESDVTVELVCVKIEDDGSFDEESLPYPPEGASTDEDAAGFLAVPTLLLSSLVAAALWVGI